MQYASKEEIGSRIAKLKPLMEKASLDGAFFHYKIDYFYLSGTMQDSLLFVPLDGEPILFVRQEINRARRESPLDAIIPIRSHKDIKAHIKPMKRVGLQLDVIPYNDVVKFQEIIGDAELINVSPLTKELRKIKIPFRDRTDGKGGGHSKRGIRDHPLHIEGGNDGDRDRRDP